MWLPTSEVWFLFILFINVDSRPQTDPEASNLLNNPRVAIEDKDIAVPRIDYKLLGDPKVCGFSSKNLAQIARTGGGVAKLRDWPWMAVFIRKSDNFHFCGGVLITPRHVLTAAHCFKNIEAKDIFVRLGEYDFTKDNESKINDFGIRDIRIHEDWDTGTFQNDIAILYLEKPVFYNIYSQPICLPLPLQDFTNTTAIVAGWGTIQFAGPMSDVLLEVPVPIWDQQKCSDSFTQTIFSTVQCAAGHEGGKDACQGDSGGPLMTQRDDGRWVTIGIVSWGIGCGDKEKPGVYTRVNKYLDWIAERIQDHLRT